MTPDGPQTIYVYNPLPGALLHYEAEMAAVLRESGIETIRLDAVSIERRTGAAGKLADLVRHLIAVRRHVRRARRSGAPVLVLWPALHWIEFIAWSRFGLRRRATSPVLITVHDPLPLRPQFGLGARWARVARLFSRFALLPTPVALSPDASEEVERLLGVPPVVCRHPILPPGEAASRERGGRETPFTVGVFGQYKPARDLSILRDLPAAFDPDEATFVLIGRGWPTVPGWIQTSEFVTEERLRQEMLDVEVVLLPYDRYFQSGIAIRAMELGKPVVGRPTAFIRELFGASYGGYVEDDTVIGWRTAIVAARDEEIDRRHREFWTDAVVGWANAVRQTRERR